MTVFPFARNIKAIRLDNRMSQERFGESLGVTKQTVIQWEKGRVRVPKEAEIIDRIRHVYRVTDNDLFGDGDGYHSRSTGIQTSLVPMTSETYAPVLGRISAGEPREAIEMNGEMRWVRPDILDRYPDGFFVHISGDSMDRILPEGTYAFVAPGDVSNGDIAAVKVNGDDACVKRVLLSPELNLVKLIPESSNPAHKPIVIDGDDPDAPRFKVIGKVVWFDVDL